VLWLGSVLFDLLAVIIWDNQSTGRYTYELIHDVKTKVIFSKVRDIGIAYCRMLLNDTVTVQALLIALYVTVEKPRNQLNTFCCIVRIMLNKGKL